MLSELVLKCDSCSEVSREPSRVLEVNLYIEPKWTLKNTQLSDQLYWGLFSLELLRDLDMASDLQLITAWNHTEFYQRLKLTGSNIKWSSYVLTPMHLHILT